VRRESADLILLRSGSRLRAVPFTFVSHALCRHGAGFFQDFRDFSPVYFLKSGVICPPTPANFAGSR